jgi:hypothetical protein
MTTKKQATATSTAVPSGTLPYWSISIACGRFPRNIDTLRTIAFVPSCGNKYILCSNMYGLGDRKVPAVPLNGMQTRRVLVGRIYEKRSADYAMFRDNDEVLEVTDMRRLSAVGGKK